jgi:NADPH2:quinone reductase
MRFSLFDINRLSGITGFRNNGSLYLTFATLNNYAARREDLLRYARDVLTGVAEGALTVRLAGTFPLAEAAAAHRLLENRQVVGKLLLLT